jgi:hypothetical protein
MTYDDVIKYFGSAYKVGKTGMFSLRTPYSWRRNGFIPIKTQMKIQAFTNGDLMADLAHCKKMEIKSDE